jgi:hypothetical protein
MCISFEGRIKIELQNEKSSYDLGQISQTFSGSRFPMRIVPADSVSDRGAVWPLLADISLRDYNLMRLKLLGLAPGKKQFSFGETNLSQSP